MHETQRRIVDLLRLRGAQTIDELGGALSVTRTAVATHLGTLQSEGVVVRRGLRPGRRRPSVLYGLTPQADALFPKAYGAFASALLEELRREPHGRLSAVLRRIGDGWIRRDASRVARFRGPERLSRMREILSERGFLPALERTADGYLLREHNCPLMELAQRHPEVCQMVHRWLEALAGTPMVRVKCMREGDPYSAYMIPRGSAARRASS